MRLVPAMAAPMDLPNIAEKYQIWLEHKESMKHEYYLTNSLAVDRFCAVKLANLNYKEGSDRNDDHGSLWVAPVIKTNWDAPVGLLALYASTNGDPIHLGQIEHGELTWIEATDHESGMDDSLREVLKRADWQHPASGEGYSYLVEESLSVAQ